jgi:hypothetical protein
MDDGIRESRCVDEKSSERRESDEDARQEHVKDVDAERTLRKKVYIEEYFERYRRKKMVVMVSGWRGIRRRDEIRKELIGIPVGSKLIHGDCAGADRIAGEIGKRLGLDVVACPPDWKRGKYAGLEQNKSMISKYKPDLLLAFHPIGGLTRGTRHAVEYAAYRVPVIRLVEVAQKKK